MGLLIINADDLGGTVAATDAIARCFDAGAITSASFMVHMRDSERAAEITRAHDWPVGLHLNLTQPFDADGVPAPVRERQLDTCDYFSNLRKRRLLPEPRPGVRRLIAAVIGEQLERFEELHRRAPTHLDSHQHAHTTAAALAALPRKLPLRRTASRRAALIARRFATTDCFMGFPDVAAAVAAAADHTAELMVHPSFEDELEVLLSDDWARQLTGAQLGSFADLPFEQAPASGASV